MSISYRKKDYLGHTLLDDEDSDEYDGAEDIDDIVYPGDIEEELYLLYSTIKEFFRSCQLIEERDFMSFVSFQKLCSLSLQHLTHLPNDWGESNDMGTNILIDRFFYETTIEDEVAEYRFRLFVLREKRPDIVPRVDDNLSLEQLKESYTRALKLFELS